MDHPAPVTPRHDALVDPVAGLHELIDGYRRSQVVCAAARLGLADLLAGGPLTLGEMAAECGVPAAALGRLMRALVGLDVCTVGPEGYRTTALGRALEASAPGGGHERALLAADLHYPAWTDLTDRLCGAARTAPPSGSVPVPAGPDRDDGETRRIASACAVPAGSTIVDVGGSGGTLLAELLRAHPGCHGVHHPGTPGVGGVPGGGDVYLLSGVLHECDDEGATTLLRAVRRAMHRVARLLVVERLMPEDPDADTAPACLQDLHLLVTTGGCERTEAEYAALLSTTGLRHVDTVVPGGLWVVMQARLA